VAKASFKLPEDFLLKLSKLGEKTDQIIPKVLNAGAKVVEAKVKSNLESVIGKGTKADSRSTGELVASLGISEARQDKKGNFNVKVGFSEPRRDGETNALIATVLEYGKQGQPPKPFLKLAYTSSKNACIEAMETAFEQEVENI